MQIAVVLAVGFDSSLMRTRSLVLQSAGHRRVSIIAQGGVARFQTGDFDLILLCHSIPLEGGII